MIPMRAVNPAAEQSARYDVTSPLLFGALQSLSNDSQMVLFDPTPATDELLAFFSAYHCKLFLPGCQQELLSLHGDGQAETSFTDVFQHCLPMRHCESKSLDLILLWDLPNYLDRAVLSALIHYLSPYVGPHTLIHTYIHTRQQMPEYPADFRLTSRQTVSVQMTGHWNLSSPMYHQHLLNRVMAPFHIDRGMLLANGLQEYILRMCA